MKKLFKNVLALTLSIVLIASSLMTGFSVLAADTVNSEPLNLDFSDGLNHWIGDTSIYSVDGGVLKTNDTYTEGSWRWLKTEAFNIPNAVAGTTVKLTFDVEFENNLLSMKDHASYQNYLNSDYGSRILDTYLAD